MELDGLWGALGENWNKDALAALVAAGVSLDALVAAEKRTGFFPVAISRGIREQIGRFRFDEAGAPIYCVIDTNGADTIYDVIAFSLAEPHRPATLNGWSQLLNEEYCGGELLMEGDCRLFSTPLDWLRNGGDGGCIVDWSLPPWLLSGGRVICDTPELARRLRMAFARPVDGPQIMIEQKQAAVAA